MAELTMKPVRNRGRDTWRLGLVMLLVLGEITGVGSAKPAYAAATITVNTTSDETLPDGKCSLREAIANANANTDTTGGDCVAGSPGSDTINLLGLSGIITLDSNLPAISDALTVSGPGASALTINASGNLNVFQLFATQAAISGVTLTGATAGAIVNSAATTLSDDSVSGNDNTDFTGRVGGILNFGTLTIRNSAVSGNTGISSGGILNNGTLMVINSTLSGNSGRQGGAISNNNVLTIESSTISGNTAGAGGGLDTGNNATIRNSTIANNTATSIGGGIYGGGLIENTTIANNHVGPVGFAPGIFSGGNITLLNSIVADQTGGPNCIGVGPASDGGYNVDDGASCKFSAINHSLSSTNPLLDPAGLQNNGGPTQTIALLPGSPAVDAIPPGPNGCGTTLTSDQRGVSRPQGSGCDIGAFELLLILTVAIDIKPGDLPNPINPGSNGTIPVAILSSSGFNAPSQVDPASLKFGRTGSESSLVLCSPPQDVNGDGLPDLLCHFATRKTGFQIGDIQGVLTGRTVSGTQIQGTDSVVIVPPK